MSQALQLHSVDLPVAFRLAERPEVKYEHLAADLGISASTAHGAVRRLDHAGLLRPSSRTVNWLALREFLAHGLRYAFAARPGAELRGIPTAHSAPPLASHIVSDDALVWPDSRGSAVGREVVPLYPHATALPERCPSAYELLALADAVRVGRARERGQALEWLEARLGRGS